MAVNYGLGGFEQGSAFFAAYNNSSQTIGITTQNVGDPSNNTIQAYISKNNLTNYGIQLGYCRSGDFFEVGSQALIYANNNDFFNISVANTDGTNDVVLHNINVSIVKLKYGGRING
jgi:hypothetical protein